MLMLSSASLEWAYFAALFLVVNVLLFSESLQKFISSSFFKITPRAQGVASILYFRYTDKLTTSSLGEEFLRQFSVNLFS